MTGLCLASCGTKPQTATEGADAFNYVVDQFADVQILRYRVPDFETLSLQQKLLVYYLSQAAVEGRDILYDQNGRHNLCIRRTLEAVYENYGGDRSSADFKALETYLKQVWMGNGIHHHYSMDKFVPAFSQAFFAQAVQGIDPAKAAPGRRRDRPSIGRETHARHLRPRRDAQAREPGRRAGSHRHLGLQLLRGRDAARSGAVL